MKRDLRMSREETEALETVLRQDHSGCRIEAIAGVDRRTLIGGGTEHPEGLDHAHLVGAQAEERRFTTDSARTSSSACSTTAVTTIVHVATTTAAIRQCSLNKEHRGAVAIAGVGLGETTRTTTTTTTRRRTRTRTTKMRIGMTTLHYNEEEFTILTHRAFPLG